MASFTEQEVIILDHDENLIVIDDNDGPGEVEDDDVIITDCMPCQSVMLPDIELNGFPTHSPSPPFFSSVTSLPRVNSQGTRGTECFSPRLSTSRINSKFRNLNWGSKTSKYMSSNRISAATSCPNRSESLGDPRSSATCPSPSIISRQFSGTAQQPINLDDHEISLDLRQQKISDAGKWRSRAASLSSSSILRSWRSSSRDPTVVNDVDLANPSASRDRSPDLESSSEQTRKPFQQGEVIDLEEDSIEMLRIENAYEEEEKRRKVRRKVSKVYERRNPTIVGAWQRIESTLCLKDVKLKANKTAQLKDDTFIRIKEILRNSETQEIRIRGHRLQRARDLNGLLEKKLNELVLFLEVDLDDPRGPLEQGAIEVSLEEISRLRSVRFTNQKFPLCRNVILTEFRNKEHAALDGGLTVRWTYTCTYASAADRDHNLFKERSLQRLDVEDCTPGFEISDEDSRFQWRGETILGGAYRPGIDQEEFTSVPNSSNESPTGISEALETAEVALTPHQSIELGDNDSQCCVLDEEELHSRMEKRNYSAIDLDPAEASSSSISTPKRARCQVLDEVEKTREGVARMSLQNTERSESMINDYQSNLPSDSPPCTETIDLCIELPRMIDLVPSDPTTAEDNIPLPPKQRKAPVTRTAYQTYTYGDAFCGGGGSSRGATMAGLRLQWGFDFNKNACLSWRANFPWAICHEMAAHEFVQLSKTHLNSDAMKVDILHLSPPCQFFSPAHTVEGVDDEMNVASLFAVQTVIEVSRARIVTLEQTFGIACSRFRFYFNALIQMFTTHDFSVRWAIVPLAQWGLPQRRNRLIIIASCPGEPLPKMPLPTHSAADPAPPFSLLPLVSANKTLASIPYNADDHDIAAVTWLPERYMKPWDGSKILPRAMTTSGGQNYHPSGTRDLTLREYASLQGFPPKHVFKGNYVKKQIGNAVPPVVAKVLFGSIKGDLERADGVEGPDLIE
ncbi:C-5 cytosine-specific DNA methylase [Diplocarpon rosae]|nr:C-5 cytosine-specific DNA methylase [Diplocarpon rosae]